MRILFSLFNIFYKKRLIVQVQGQSKLYTNRSNKPMPIIEPKNINQELYNKVLNNTTIPLVVGIGPAGTGKTMMACTTAIEHLKMGIIDKIIITRPFITVEESIGYLPGNIIKKMNPYTRPIMDIFNEYYTQTQIDNMLATHTIEISPLGFMRGRTFKKAFIIADEMQNSSPNQMFMLITRIGNHSRLAITGDLQQSDYGEKNGLFDFITRVRSSTIYLDDYIRIIEFSNNDIERSKIVSTIMKLYNNKNNDCAIIPKNLYKPSLEKPRQNEWKTTRLPDHDDYDPAL